MVQSAHPAARAVLAASGVAGLPLRQTVFEGLKAYPSRQRPDRPVPAGDERARGSSCRPIGCAFRDVDDAFFLEAVRALVENERHFVPAAPGCLYIRPTADGRRRRARRQELERVHLLHPDAAVGPVLQGRRRRSRVRLTCSSASRWCARRRALMGSVKAGANYAGTLKITEDAKALGCAQVLFLDARDHQYIEEMGGMNIMFVQGNRCGRRRSPTPSWTASRALAARDRARSRPGDQRSSRSPSTRSSPV